MEASSKREADLSLEVYDKTVQDLNQWIYVSQMWFLVLHYFHYYLFVSITIAGK
jgi:hypothetical protein